LRRLGEDSKKLF